MIGGLMALYSLRILGGIKEQGEVDKDKVVTYMRSKIRKSVVREAKGIYTGKPLASLRKAFMFFF